MQRNCGPIGNFTTCCIPLRIYRALVDVLFFPGPQAFCKKAVERVRSEKNILNSSVEWSGWSGFF